MTSVFAREVPHKLFMKQVAALPRTLGNKAEAMDVDAAVQPVWTPQFPWSASRKACRPRSGIPGFSSQSRRAFSVTVAVALAAICLVAFGASDCHAQLDPATAPPPETAPEDPTQSGIVPGSLAYYHLPEKYANWHDHSGTAPQCVVSVHVDARAGAPALTMPGLVVRCDGFILLPAAGYTRLRDPGATGTVAVIGAEGESITSPIPIAGWQRANHTARRAEYGLIKVNDHHLRCLPLLSDACVGKSIPVDIVAAAADNGTGVCKPLVYTALVDRVPEGSEHDSHHAEHFSLIDIANAPMGSARGGSSPAAASEIPAGAIVVDHESGAAVGMVTVTGSLPIFTTFTQFGQAFHDIPIAPSRAAIVAHEPNASTRTIGAPMVRVPGGPIRLMGSTLSEYENRFGTDIVCMPDFYIDKFPVTNVQYRDWLRQKGGAVTQPGHWSDEEIDQPVRRDDLPVTAIFADSAALYAQDLDRRLVTEVEWQRAIPTESLDWLQPMNNAVEKLVHDYTIWNELWKRDLAAFQQLQDLKAAAARQKGQDPDAAGTTSPPPDPDLQIKLQELGNQAVSASSSGWIYGEIHPVDTYPLDKSVFGARDVVTNAPEIVMAGSGSPAIGPKVAPAHADPYISNETQSVGDDSSMRYFIEIIPAWGRYFIDRVICSGTGTHIAYGVSGYTFSASRHKVVWTNDSGRYTASPLVDLEFRCAR